MYMELEERCFMGDDINSVLIRRDGENLKRLAKEAGLSIYELAELSGVNKQTLYTGIWRGGGFGTGTLNAVSVILAQTLDRKPSEVYAELTGIDSL